MTYDARNFWRGLLNAALVSGLLVAGALGSTGCDKKPEEQLLIAKMAVVNSKPDLAERHLEPVLKADPDNFEGLRLMASVDQLRGEFASAEEKFLALQKAHGFQGDAGEAGAGELTPKQKSQKELLENDLTMLYLDWAQSLEDSEDFESFEKVARKGLKLAPKQPRLNTLLVDAYENHAKKLVEQGKKAQAAAFYEKIPQLYTNSATRNRAKERASNLRFEAARAEMLEYFNETAKPKLVAENRYDTEKKLIIFNIKQDVSEVESYYREKQGERVRLNPNNEAHRARIQQYAISEKLKPALIELVVEATGVPADSDFSKLASPAGFEVVNIEPGRRDLSITAQVPLDSLLKLGSDVRENARLAAAEAEQQARDAQGAPGEAGEEGAPQPDAGAADADAPAP